VRTSGLSRHGVGRGPAEGKGRDPVSELYLLRDAEGVVDLDAAFELGVAEEELHRAQVPGLLVDLGRFRPALFRSPVFGSGIRRLDGRGGRRPPPREDPA
jgi:hypothetical protein